MESSPTNNLSALPEPLLVRVGQFFFRYRDFLSPLVLLCLVGATRPLRIAHRLDDWIGITLVIFGQGLRAAVIGFAYIKRGGKDKQVYADTLVQEGFFAHSRNPLYVGNVLTILGFLVVHNSLLGYVIGVPFYLFLYWTIVLAEEDFLRTKFGQVYEDYCRRVNRFLPDFRGLGRSLEGMSYDWRRLIRKEYGTTYSAIFAVICIIAWDDYHRAGHFVRDEVILLGSIWLLAGAGWVFARLLKKGGSLASA